MSSRRVAVCLEVAPKQTVASALDWPGWCRAGRDESAALEALASYAERYALVAERAGVSFPSTVAFDVGDVPLRGVAGPADLVPASMRCSPNATESLALSATSPTASMMLLGRGPDTPPGHSERTTDEWSRATRRPQAPPLTPLPNGWATDTQPASEQFRTALATAIRRGHGSTRAKAALLRYGLGRTRRPLTNAEVAHRLAISPGNAQRATGACIDAIHTAATAALPARPTAYQRASLTAAHLASEILGDLDRTTTTADRIRAFVDQALPDVDPATATRLLIRLTGQHWRLPSHEIQRLIIMVKASDAGTSGTPRHHLDE